MTTRHWLNNAALAILAIVSVTSFGHAQQATPSEDRNARVEAVWGREELYWRLVQAGDVDNYRALWNEGFRGWPCKAQHTATKANIADWVRDIRDQKVKLRYSLTREGAADFGDIVVIYYQTPIIYEYPDGRVVDRDRVFKFTHTWRKNGKTWEIIGGMCGELPPQTSP
ncbi:MAG TPA: DUF4440 domain-containing protein [Pyrinomonadaceae bacterium]|nr:DUF4440 domain-containing protein [Pyrinomonadaceae bacterium]